MVIDNGTSKMRAGFAGDDKPRVTFPSIVGYTKSEYQLQNLFGNTQKRSFVGYEALGKLKRGIVTGRYPIEDGVVTNWDAMDEVRVECTPKEHIGIE